MSGSNVFATASASIAVVGGADVVAGELQLQRQRLGRVVVVVGDEDSLRLDRGNRRSALASDSERAASWVAMTGSRTVNSAPRPGPSLCTVTVPPCISVSRRTSARPIPSPPCARSDFECTCVNSSKIFGISSGAIPIPVSAILIDHVLTVSPRRSAGFGRRGP